MDRKTEMPDSKDALKCPCCSAEHESFFLCNAGKDGKYPQYQCRRCGFQFSWPCPPAEEIDRFYASGEYYARTGGGENSDPGDYEDYDEQIKYTLVFFRNILKDAALPEKSSLLDVGCALGRFMELAWKEFGFECAGVELSDYARNYVKEHYDGRFPVWKSVDEMPVPERKFDLILLFDVIEHVNSPWSLLLELFRHGCIGENTRILITTPNCTFRDAAKDPAAWQYRYPPAHLSFCTPETFQKIGETLLFRHIDIAGHSLKEEGARVGEMLQETYSGYDGLICSFSGSTLGRIPPERFPASLEELKRSPEYLALLSEFAFERRNKPFNPQFRVYLAELYDRLTFLKGRLESELAAERNRANELTSRNGSLASELEAERGRANELASRNGSLASEIEAQRGRVNELASELEAERSRVNELLSQNSRLISGLERANWNSYSQWLQLLDSFGRLDQLLSQNGEKESRLRELSGYVSHLENQVRDLAGQRDHLQNRERELSGYVSHLEAQVRENAAKLNEVYHSRSYRMSRAITWPLRKCKAAAAFIREKANSCRRLGREYGAAYMWRCVFRKLTGRPIRRPYDVVSSLGVNCEVSFNLNRYHGFVDSYPLIWAYVHSLEHLPELIADPMSLASERKMEHNYEHNMVRFTDIDVSFHCKGMPADLLGPDGKVDEKKAQAERDELRSRLAYLAGKWKKLLQDPARSVLCILTPWEEESTTEEVLAIHDALRKYPATDLLVVLTGKEKKISAFALRSRGIFVRYIARHPADDKTTDLQANDIPGWNRICHEFPPLNRKVTGKVFKYEK